MIMEKMIKTAVFFAITLVLSSQVQAEDPKGDIYLYQLKDVSGFSFEPKNLKSFTVATPHGIFSVEQNGIVQKINETPGYFIELVSHPDDPSILYSSGFKSETEKLGVLRSKDAGKTWEKISKNDVAFYSMAISATNPNILYGVDEDIQTSRDGGKTWEKTSTIPGDRVFELAISPRNANVVYAATYKGLFISKDGGKSWEDKGPEAKPMSSLLVTMSGELHAFVYGHGYITAKEDDLKWARHSKDFQNRAVLNLTLDPNNKNYIYGVADTGAVMISKDAGTSWGSFEGHQYANAERINKGKTLFENNCVACHGAKGVGEKPDDPSAVDGNNMPFAPALNDSTHAWHHSDDQIMLTILNGSPRNERMIAWKEHDVSKEDAESLVAYIKSLWNFTSLSCQGPRHMSCM
jgi:mono/diheme cytochrome c family protein